MYRACPTIDVPVLIFTLILPLVTEVVFVIGIIAAGRQLQSGTPGLPDSIRWLR